MRNFLGSLCKTLGMCCFATGVLISTNVFADDHPGMPTVIKCTGTATSAAQCTANSTLCPVIPAYDCIGIMKADTITFDYCQCIT